MKIEIKKIKRAFVRILYVEYRLTIIKDGKSQNIYSLSKKNLINSGRTSCAEYWSLYKTGPFGLAEREVGRGGTL